MRTMTTTNTSATMGKDQIGSSVMMVKVGDHHQGHNVSNSTDGRPATTTAIGTSTTNARTSKHAFRFPRFSLKSPSTMSAATTPGARTSPPAGAPPGVTPRTYRRLRSFPLLRIRSHPVDGSEASAITSVSPQAVQSTTSSGSSSSDSTTTTSQSRASVRRESREDFVMRCTKIVTVPNGSVTVPSGSASVEPEHSMGEAEVPELPAEDELELEGDDDYQVAPPEFSCATAILQHSYLEMVCGRPSHALEMDDVDELGTQQCRSPRKRRLPDDPTVQDSIECVFASQLEEGLPLWADDENDEDEADLEHRDEQEHLQPMHSYEEEPINAPSEAELPSPAPLMQSRQKSRTPLPVATRAMISNKRRSHPSNNSRNKDSCGRKPPRLRLGADGSSLTQSSSSLSRRRKKYQTAKMVHVGTFDPRTNRILEVAETDHNLMEEDPAVTVASRNAQSPPRSCGHCFCHSHSAPVVPADYWPQAPLLLRPTPGEGMTVRGVRFSGQSEHFWTPSDGGWWLTPLYELAGKEAPSLTPGVPSMCPQCCLLPINNGNEKVGEALVTDFETPLFEGSLLVRLRHVDGGATSTDPATLDYDDTKGYFAGLNRRYQVVIRGKFKREVPWTGLVAGCVMDRPCGRLPPKWIMKGAVKVLSFFAPQLELDLDCPRPKTMAPLGSTPQALIVQEVGPQDRLPPLDGTVEEPREARRGLLGEAYHGSTSLQRARGRKKAFDKLYAARSRKPATKPSSGGKETYYTFEFLQHLVNFQDFSVELGNLLGSIPIAPILSGQPIPIMAMIKEGEQKIWSFDIWHQELVGDAKEHDAQKFADMSR